MRNAHNRLPLTAVGAGAPRRYPAVMKTNRPSPRFRHPVSGKIHRIPRVRTFAFLTLMLILIVLALLGHAMPPGAGFAPPPILPALPANGPSSTNSPAPARAP